MPYDEEGRFIYPLPARKKKQKAENPVSPPRPEIAVPKTVPEPVPAPELERLPNPDLPNTAEPRFADQFSEFCEQELAELWNAQSWPEGLELKTTQGVPVKVIYRGRWSFGLGPDFRGAILNLGGEVRRGDIELHRAFQDWQTHGHQQNPVYDGVILHVALNSGTVVTAGGQVPATLDLLQLFKQDRAALKSAIQKAQQSGTRLGSLSESDGPCCEMVAQRHPDLEEVLGRIDGLGEKRFLVKAARFEAACSQLAALEQHPAQAFWEGLLEGLGYSHNKAPFVKLAQLLPLSTVLEIDRENRRRGDKPGERVISLEALLLGAAGLLPSQRRVKLKPNGSEVGGKIQIDPVDWAATEYAEELERRWELLFRFVANGPQAFKPMAEKEWSFARVRPSNHPARRIAGLARWLVKQNFGDEQAAIETLIQRLTGFSPSEASISLAAFFTSEPLSRDTESDQFWALHYDLTLNRLPDPGKDGSGPALIGADRAADIVVNIALPFLYGYGQESDQKSIAERAEEAYRQHPRLASNELVETVARQVFRFWLEGPGEIPPEFRAKGKRRAGLNLLINGAMRQQGLIQLHHNFCTEQNWGTCPLA